MGHWKTGVKILCSKSWEGQNSMKAKIWGSKFYFFLVEPLVKILCSLKRGVKILYFFPVPWKRGVKTAEPTNQLHWRGAPPGGRLLHSPSLVAFGLCNSLPSHNIRTTGEDYYTTQNEVTHILLIIFTTTITRIIYKQLYQIIYSTGLFMDTSVSMAAMGHVALVSITGTTILVPYHLVKSLTLVSYHIVKALQLIRRPGS